MYSKSFSPQRQSDTINNKLNDIKHFGTLCDLNFSNNGLMFQYQKFGKKQSLSRNEEEDVNLNQEINKVPKTYQQKQFTQKQVIVATPDFVGVMKFTTFKIIIQNQWRYLDFEETFQVLQSSSDYMLNFLQNNIKFEFNEILADFSTFEINVDYQIYQLPEQINIQIPFMGVVIEFPKIVMYSQMTNSQQLLKITNQEVIDLIKTNFCDLQLFHNRFDFTIIKIEMRKIRNKTTKLINIYENVSKLSLKLVPNKSKSSQKQLNNYLYKQVSQFGDQFYISKFITSQVRVLDELQQEIYCKSLSLEQFKLLCFYSRHKGLDLFLYYVKLIQVENKIQCQLPEALLKKYADLNIFNDESMHNGLGRKIDCSHNFNNKKYTIQLIPPKFIIYNPIDNYSTEIPVTHQLLEILILNNYNVIFQIY